VSTRSFKPTKDFEVTDIGTIGAEIMNQAVRNAVEKN
jgi:hypothetical protein